MKRFKAWLLGKTIPDEDIADTKHVKKEAESVLETAKTVSTQLDRLSSQLDTIIAKEYPDTGFFLGDALRRPQRQHTRVKRLHG